MLTPKYDLVLAEFASNHGLSVNQFNRVYHQGKAMSLEKKVSIAVEYLKAQDAANGARPNISELSRVCQVQRSSRLLETLGLDHRITVPFGGAIEARPPFFARQPPNQVWRRKVFKGFRAILSTYHGEMCLQEKFRQS